LLSTSPKLSTSILLAPEVSRQPRLLVSPIQDYRGGDTPRHTLMIWEVPIQLIILIRPQIKIDSRVNAFPRLHLNDFPIISSLQHRSVEWVPVPSTPRLHSIVDRGVGMKPSRITTLLVMFIPRHSTGELCVAATLPIFRLQTSNIL
jgi:hypothetical protein